MPSPRTCIASAFFAVAGFSVIFSCNSNFAPLPAPLPTPAEFVNFETPHVSPIAITPNGLKLLAVNTPDNRLEIFDLKETMPISEGNIGVGLDPVSVRVPNDNEAWVVNSISDSISIIDLNSRMVVRTLETLDEPADVGFAHGRAFVTCAQESKLLVYDLANLDSVPQVIDLQGEEPRAIAVSADGLQIYVAFFESGNGSTIIDERYVSFVGGPYDGKNPPPNKGKNFFPAMAEGLPKPPRVGMIVKRDAPTGEWLDDNNHAWSTDIVQWQVADNDIAVIEADTLDVRYIRGLMNIDMQLSTRPDGRLVVVGTDSTNEVRFEPNLTGRFVHSKMAVVDPGNELGRRIVDLNPHLDEAYEKKLGTVSKEKRDMSIADPRGVAWRMDGQTGFVSGMGSDNVAVVNQAGLPIAHIDVGAGPTGLALDEARERLYVLNKFDSSISVVDTAGNVELGRVGMFDPTPARVRAGRPILYNARKTSGLGVTACGSCHVDARWDGLAWDLGSPSGEMKPFNQFCDRQNGLDRNTCGDFHPMKGPLVTQTLQGIMGVEPLHWRGDREDLGAFNPAFVGLLGNERQMTPDEMGMFADLLGSIRFPPNPYRNLDGSLKTFLAEFNGDPMHGEELYHTGFIDQQILNCVDCHIIGSGSDRSITPARSLTMTQSFKVPQLRGVYKKLGFRKSGAVATRGFGFLHDGRFETVADLLHLTPFVFADGELGEQQRRDLGAFVMSFATETHPAVGRQVTLTGKNNSDAAVTERLSLLLRLAEDKLVGVIARGKFKGELRSFEYLGHNIFQSDRLADTATLEKLVASAAPGAEFTFTAVPRGTQRRIAIDRDADGVLDGDELDAGTDPKSADSSRIVIPGY